jgi:hypothetical protein
MMNAACSTGRRSAGGSLNNGCRVIATATHHVLLPHLLCFVKSHASLIHASSEINYILFRKGNNVIIDKSP